MSEVEDVRARLLEAQQELSAAIRHNTVTEASTGRAAGILLEVDPGASNPDLSEGYAALATARASMASIFNDLQRAWQAVSKVTGSTTT